MAAAPLPLTTCTDVPTNGGTCTFAVQTVVCGYITGNRSSDEISVVSQKFNTDQSLECTCSGAVASAILLATALTVCGSIFVITVPVLLVKLRKHKTDPHNNNMEHQLDEDNYEVVKHQDSTSGPGGINTRKNITYGQVHIT